MHGTHGGWAKSDGLRNECAHGGASLETTTANELLQNASFLGIGTVWAKSLCSLKN